MGFLIGGIILLILASFWHSYCAIASKSSPVFRPVAYYSNPVILQVGWIILFIIGLALLFVYHWIAGVVGGFIYWFLLPVFVHPVVRKWMLPSWDELSDELKDTLKRIGYDEKNYLRGNWWKKDMVQRELEKLIKGK